MALDLEYVKKTVAEYANAVRRELPVRKVILFGSYAKGTARKHSDVDVCFFVGNLTDDNWIELMVKLRVIMEDYPIYISPTVYHVSDINDNGPFVKEVLRTGTKIL
jgi:predicted nucleotidyltransferase